MSVREKILSKGKSALLLAAASACIAAVGAAFFLPWFDHAIPGGTSLNRYAPLVDGSARRAVTYDKAGAVTETRADNDILLPPARAVASDLQPRELEALQKFFRREGETAVGLEQLIGRLKDVQLYRTKSRTLAADGKVSELSILALRDERGDCLVSLYDEAKDSLVLFDPPLALLPSNLSPGFVWRQTGQRKMGASAIDYESEGKIEGLESVTTGEGTEEKCLRVATRMRFTKDGKILSDGRSIYWYAPGAGCVKWQDLTPEEELKDAGLVVTGAKIAVAPSVTTPKTDLGDPGKWKLSPFAVLRGSADAGSSTIPAQWIPTEPPLVLGARYGGDLTALDQTGEARWSFHAGGSIYGRLAYDAVRAQVLFGASDKKLYAVGTDGLFRWAFPTGDNVSTRPVVYQDTVIFGAEDRTVYWLDAATGRMLHQQETDGPVIASPVLAGDLVAIGGADGSVHGFDAVTAAERWTYTGDDPVESPMAADGEAIFFGDRGGNVVSLNVKTGQPNWTSPVGNPVTAEVAVSPSAVFVVAGGDLVAFNRETGERLWRVTESDFVGPVVVVGDQIVAAHRAGKIELLDAAGQSKQAWNEAEANQTGRVSEYRMGLAAGGNSLWIADDASNLQRLGPPVAAQSFLKPAWMKRFNDAPLEGNFLNLTPVAYGQRAVVVDAASTVFLIDPVHGTPEKVAALSTPAPPTVEPALKDDTLYVSGGAKLTAVDLKQSRILWTYTGSGPCFRPPAVDGQNIVWMTNDPAKEQASQMTAFDAATGAVRWQKAFQHTPSPGGALLEDGTVYASAPPAAWNLRDGSPVWELKTDRAGIGGPVFDPGGALVFLGLSEGKSGAGSVVAVDKKSGIIEWTAQLKQSILNPLERLWVAGETLVVPVWDGSIVGLDRGSGQERWDFKPPGTRRGGITVDGNEVWLAQQNLSVLGLDAATGEVNARFALEINLSSIPTFAPRPLVMDHRLITPFSIMLLGLDVPATLP